MSIKFDWHKKRISLKKEFNMEHTIAYRQPHIQDMW